MVRGIKLAPLALLEMVRVADLLTLVLATGIGCGCCKPAPAAPSASPRPLAPAMRTIVVLPEVEFSDEGDWDFEKQEGRLQLWPAGTQPMEKGYRYVVTIRWEETSDSLDSYAAKIFGHIEPYSYGLVPQTWNQPVGKCPGKAARLKVSAFSTESDPIVLLLVTTSRGKGFELACRASDAGWLGDCEKGLKSFSIASCH